jgi:hypothetical protein
MDKKTIVFLSVVAVMIAAIVLRTQKKRGNNRQALQSSSINSNASAPSESLSVQGNSTLGNRETNGSSAGVQAAPTIGSAYVKDEKGRRYLTIELSPINQCQNGDADAMLALARDRGGKLIATLEPIDVKDASKAVTKEITSSDFSLGTNFALEVKEDSPKVFALYLCSDVSNAQSCRNKPPAKLAFGYESFLSSLEASSSKDFVFFVHLLVLGKDNYQVYQSDFELSNISKTIAVALNKKNLSDPEMSTARDLSKLLKTIRPYPVAALNDGTVGTVLRISITRKESSMCGQ